VRALSPQAYIIIKL